MVLPRIVVLTALVFATACGTQSPGAVDHGTDGGFDASVAGCDAGGAPLCCVGSCGNDVVTQPVCAASSWSCPSGSVQCAQGQCTTPPPSSSLKLCADPDAGVCLGGCRPDEVCFTQFSCGLLQDGGSVCTWGMNPDAGGDNRCHRLCSGPSGPCGGGESCLQASFFGCADYNAPRFLCCPGGGCP